MIGFVHIVYANTVGWLWTWLLRKKNTTTKKKASSAPNVTRSVKFLVIHLALFTFISFSVESGLLSDRAFSLLKPPSMHVFTFVDHWECFVKSEKESSKQTPKFNPSRSYCGPGCQRVHILSLICA